MLQTLRNAWRIPDLRRKLMFTVFILLIYRFGAAVFVPFIDSGVLQDVFESSGAGDSILGLFNMMGGGALSRGTIFAVSSQP